MKENKEIKEKELEVKASEAQETEQQEQQAEAPNEEQKQEENKEEKPEKAKKEHPILDKVGNFGKKVGRGIKKAAPIAGAVIVGLGVGKLLGKVEAYQELTVDPETNTPELPDNGEQPAPEIEDAEFHEISTDEQSVE